MCKAICFTGVRNRMKNSPEQKLKMSLLLDYYGDMLTGRQKEIAALYLNDDLSLSEIAELVGITRQGVRDALVKSEGILLSCEEKLGMLERFRRLQTRLEQIASRLAPEEHELAEQLRSLSL